MRKHGQFKLPSSTFWADDLLLLERTIYRYSNQTQTCVYEEGDPLQLNYFLNTLGALLSGKRVVLLSAKDSSLFRQKLKAIVDPKAPPPREGSLVIFTSGSSGPPKGIEITLSALTASARSFSQFFGNGDGHNPLPQNHIGGWMACFRAFLSGHKIFLKRGSWEHSQKHNQLRTSMVPTQIYRLLQQDINFLKLFDLVLIGGAACSPSLFEKLKQHKIKAAPSYGLTESVAVLASTHPDRLPTTPNTFEVLPDREVKIIENRLAFRSQAKPEGFWEKGMFKKTPLTNGYFITQDLAKWGTSLPHSSSQKTIHILGRADLVFQSGGINCHPLEIEEALESTLQPYLIDKVIIVPLPSTEWGEKPCALYHSPHFQKLDWKQIKKAISQLPPHFIPKNWLPLPHSTGIKPNRYQLKKYAWEQLQ